MLGASVVNALSEWLVVTIKRDGNIYEQRFENGGVPATTLEKIGKTKRVWYDNALQTRYNDFQHDKLQL